MHCPTVSLPPPGDAPIGRRWVIVAFVVTTVSAVSISGWEPRLIVCNIRPDVVCRVVFWRYRHKLSLRDLAEMFLQRGIVFTHGAVRGWETKLTPLLTNVLKMRSSAVASSWYTDETYVKMRGK
jgi:hypothetical protein